MAQKEYDLYLVGSKYSSRCIKKISDFLGQHDIKCFYEESDDYELGVSDIVNMETGIGKSKIIVPCLTHNFFMESDEYFLSLLKDLNRCKRHSLYLLRLDKSKIPRHWRPFVPGMIDVHSYTTKTTQDITDRGLEKLTKDFQRKIMTRTMTSRSKNHHKKKKPKIPSGKLAGRKFRFRHNVKKGHCKLLTRAGKYLLRKLKEFVSFCKCCKKKLLGIIESILHQSVCPSKRFRCPHPMCSYQCPQKSKYTHLKTCPLIGKKDKATTTEFANNGRHTAFKKLPRQIVCPNTPCPLVLNRDSLKEHLSVCRFRPIHCPNKGCTQDHLYPYEVASHMLICPYYVTICSCGKHVYRCEMEDHKKTCHALKGRKCHQCGFAIYEITGPLGYKGLWHHLEKECPARLIKCDYCTDKGPARDLRKHFDKYHIKKLKRRWSLFNKRSSLQGSYSVKPTSTTTKPLELVGQFYLYDWKQEDRPIHIAKTKDCQENFLRKLKCHRDDKISRLKKQPHQLLRMVAIKDLEYFETEIKELQPPVCSEDEPNIRREPTLTRSPSFWERLTTPNPAKYNCNLDVEECLKYLISEKEVSEINMKEVHERANNLMEHHLYSQNNALLRALDKIYPTLYKEIQNESEKVKEGNGNIAEPATIFENVFRSYNRGNRVLKKQSYSNEYNHSDQMKTITKRSLSDSSAKNCVSVQTMYALNNFQK